MNIIIYLNPDWQDEWGGDLELWDREMTHCVKKVSPKAGRAVLFCTNTYTPHGHPHPLQCPDDQARKSISTFYYTNGKPEEEGAEPHMTIWHKLPGQE
jgi:Rps23 Pro-64 3,4-dihydroxylase Tpa1-like proline 4-hydroxylase